MSGFQPKPRRTVYAKQPAIVEIETTIVCNAHCWFCPQNNTLRQPSYMEDWVWRKIVDETRGLGVIYRPFLLNEPFMDRRMPAISRYIKEDKTARLEFNTNGEALTPKVADQMIELGVDMMRFSIDGIRKETFNEARGISYDKVYRNVEYFLNAAKKARHPIDTEVRMIRFPGTEAEQAEFNAYWEAREPTRIVFTELYRYPWEGQTEAVNLPCLKIADELFFYVSGEATLCCWDSKGRAIIGDVKRESVLEIWNGEVLRHHRQLLDAGQRDQIELCSRCDAYQGVDWSEWSRPSAAAGAPFREAPPR
jgi:wyosine [tRNA(Phe)-imidazoG37] synthetase (radical SAM superfamily)